MVSMSITRSRTRKAIGIVGGVGPYAGLDLNQKIFASTPVTREQDHLEVYLLSCPSLIEDRTAYLLHPDTIENPGPAIYDVIEKLSKIGAGVIGIPCNTSHCPPILDVVEEKIRSSRLPITFVHMIREAAGHIKANHPGVVKVGLLATRGTYHSGVYTEVFLKEGIEVIVPAPESQERVHSAIYDSAYGIKYHPNPVFPEALDALSKVSEELIAADAQAVIMGCTEIPLAMGRITLSVPRIDTTMLLARALIRCAAPDVELAPL
jgi:aspartate racemase